MLLYSAKCKKNTESINPKVATAKTGKNNAFIKLYGLQ